MISPLVDEAVWEQALAFLPPWPSGFLAGVTRLIIVSPHPDDETLGAGGLIASLSGLAVDITIVAVTDGENAYGNIPGLGEIRAAEQSQAALKLGVTNEIIRLHMSDSDVVAREDELATRLTQLLDSQTLIIAPWTGDFHPDHESCGRASEVAARAANAKLAFYFFWTWHRGTPATFDGLQLVSFPLTAKELAAKQAALREHRSQLVWEDGGPILPQRLLAPSQRSYEVFAL